MNRAPTPVGTIPGVELAVGDAMTVDVSEFFLDPDGDALTYSVASSNPSTATAAASGSAVMVTAVAAGTATITVTATDPGGLSAQQSFSATVPNRAPEAAGTIQGVELAVGDAMTVDVSEFFRDLDGDALTYSVASSNAATATAAVSGSAVTVTAVAAGTATITVTATDPGGLSAQQSFTATVPNRSPEAAGTIPGLELAAGLTATVDVAAYFSDPDGDALTYTAATSNEGTATATISYSEVTITALARGTATVTVTATDVGGLSAQQQIEVKVPGQAPVATETIPDQAVSVGQGRDWHAPDYFQDPDGDALAFAAASTRSSVAAAFVDGTRFSVLGVSPGTATITLTATDDDNLSASLSFGVTVSQARSLTINSVAPDVLIEGGKATIRGSGFSRVTNENQVSVGGLPASVTAASATVLTITVPNADCLPPRRVGLRVTVAGESAVLDGVGVSPGSKDDLELPQGYYRYTYAGNGCLHLPGDATGGEYAIGVVSTSEAASSLTAVAMTSTPGDATVALEARAITAAGFSQWSGGVGSGGPLGQQRPTPELPGPSAAPEAQPRIPQRNWQLHNELMARSEALLRQLGRPRPPSPDDLARSRTREMAAGDTVTILVGGNDLRCTARGEVRAVVRLMGENAVWLDDIANPSGTFTDAQLASLDAFYAESVKGIHDSYFGSLSDVDANGRLLVLMTQEVNKEEGKGGWVWFPDLYSRDQCGTSNHAEIFFGVVPDPDGTLGRIWTQEETVEFYYSLIAHEVTHLVQANARMFGGAGRKSTWELEGGATLAEQLVAYRIFGHGSGQNMGWTEYTAGASWYDRAWVSDMALFFGWDPSGDGTGRVSGAPEECSWVGRPAEGNDGPCKNPDRAVYGVPSMVLRYALDRWGDDYPGGEQALMRRLTQSPIQGFASLADASSWRIERVLADFYLTLWGDVSGANWFASWDLADIFGRFLQNAQLRPYTSDDADFRSSWNIRAGSSSYLLWTPSGSRGPTSLKVTTASGATAPGHISVWAYRIR